MAYLDILSRLRRCMVDKEMEDYKLNNNKLPFNKIGKLEIWILITGYNNNKEEELLLNIKINYYLITLIETFKK